ncbi:MAG TPA: hypothetical protein VGB52_05300 [Actinomycetota bacterium]
MTRTFKRLLAAAALVGAILGSSGTASADRMCAAFWTTYPTEVRTQLVCVDMP